MKAQRIDCFMLDANETKALAHGATIGITPSIMLRGTEIKNGRGPDKKPRRKHRRRRAKSSVS